MRVKTANSLFIDFSLKRYAGFYQHLLNNVANFQALGDSLVKNAEQAYAFRLLPKVEELGVVLSGLPAREYQLVGQYYLGWCAYRRGEDARNIFEPVAEYSDTYRSRALSSLAALEARKGNYDVELNYITESLKYVKAPSELIEVSRGVAVVKAKEGYHQQSLRDLEELVPLLSHAEPNVYFAVLNSLAVEMGEAGRLQEARNISKAVLASPYAFAYSEWQETSAELNEANRSFVAINSSPYTVPNVLFMPAPERHTGERPTELKQAHRPAQVFNLQQWKKKVVKEPSGDEKNVQDSGEISDRQMLLKIVELASTDDLSDDALREMVEALEKIVDTYKRKES